MIAEIALTTPETPPAPPSLGRDLIPSTLLLPGAVHFWMVVVLTGIGTGIGAAALTRLLEAVQHLAWKGSGINLLGAVEHVGAWRHVSVLVGAGLVTGAGQIILRQLSSGNGIDTTAAIWFQAGRMPALRTLGSAVLSVLIVGMGVSLGREGAPEASRGDVREFFFRQGTAVRRTATAPGRLRRGSRDGRCVRRAAGRLVIRAGSHAREAGASLRAAGAFHVADCHRGFVAGAAGRADL